MATETSEQKADAVQIARHLFTVHDYELMAESGILHEDERVELICGEIVNMVPIGDRHTAVVARILDFLRRAPEDSILWVQSPIRLSGLSAPEPDVALVRRRADFYSLGKPGPADVQLVIEVADSSLKYDRLVKLPLYAAAGIPEVWIVDLANETVEVSSVPRDGAYTKKIVLPRGAAVAPGAFPEVRINVDEILGPPAPPSV